MSSSVSNIEDALVDYVLSQSLSYIGKRENFPRDVSLIEQGIFDSVEIVELIGFLRSNWKIEIAPTDYTRENMGSIRKIAAFVERKLA